MCCSGDHCPFCPWGPNHPKAVMDGEYDCRRPFHTPSQVQSIASSKSKLNENVDAASSLLETMIHQRVTRMRDVIN